MEQEKRNKYCHACAQAIDERAELCPKCGVRQASAVAQGESKRVSAALFALLLGGLGMHKFYLGKPGLGVLYLLFCWTFVPTLVAFVEGILYLSMSDSAFKAKYG